MSSSQSVFPAPNHAKKNHAGLQLPTTDETDTESEQEDRADTERDHSIRPVPEREQADRADIESDQFIQASPHDSGWVVG